MIYFIQDTFSNAIKIGHSRDPGKRLLSCQTGAAHRLVMIGAIEGGRKEEVALHARFKRFHLRGEWFKGDEKLLAMIREMPLKSISFKEWLARQNKRDDPTGDIAKEIERDARLFHWRWDGQPKSLLSRITSCGGSREARAAALRAFREYERI